MGEELKPCPFCGGAGLVVGREMHPAYWQVQCRYDCKGMIVKTNRFRHKAEAIAAWNTRAHPTAESAEDVLPFAYAYRYADGYRFSNGEEINGNRPVAAIPLYDAKALTAAEQRGATAERERCAVKMDEIADKYSFEEANCDAAEYPEGAKINERLRKVAEEGASAIRGQS